MDELQRGVHSRRRKVLQVLQRALIGDVEGEEALRALHLVALLHLGRRHVEPVVLAPGGESG